MFEILSSSNGSFQVAGNSPGSKFLWLIDQRLPVPACPEDFKPGGICSNPEGSEHNTVTDLNYVIVMLKHFFKTQELVDIMHLEWIAMDSKRFRCRV